MRPRTDDGHVRTIDICGDTWVRTADDHFLTTSPSICVEMRPRTDDGHVRTIDICGDTWVRTADDHFLTTSPRTRADTWTRCTNDGQVLTTGA